ncbi:winged helix DNA-binding domain-containing protein [Nonomuraea sp. NPDC059023]|uniref:winged helix DNA-binding domain-containing protein n=1 Tax=unclassified Nonomuraea TaxID=2593643 RepID=UPI0036A6B59E
MTPISLRQLNRTLLERHFLAERTDRPVIDVIRHVVVLQGQEPNWPYVGLWSRVEGFRRADLESLVADRTVVRSAMVRRTMHLADAADFAWLRPSVRPIVEVALTHPYYADEIAGVDLPALAEAGRAALTGRSLTRGDLAALLAERFPVPVPRRLADAVELLLPLVHTPPAAVWGRWGNRSGIEMALAEEWTGRPMEQGPALETLVLRYLAAYGPATVMDVQAWAGVTRLREIVDRLRPKLAVYEGPDGKELFDLPGAPIADPDRPVPVRFLPAFDTALLGHRDRTRVISEEHRKRFAKGASGGVPMFLVDGFVRGTWSVAGQDLVVKPLTPLSDEEDAAVAEEASLVREFIRAQ